MEYSKLSNTSIQITKEIITPNKVVTKVYEREFIEEQINDILKEIEQKQADLKELQDILAEMTKLKIVSKVEVKESLLEEEIIEK